MKKLYGFILISAFLCSCGSSNHDSGSNVLHESVVSTQQETQASSSLSEPPPNSQNQSEGTSFTSNSDVKEGSTQPEEEPVLFSDTIRPVSPEVTLLPISDGFRQTLQNATAVDFVKGHNNPDYSPIQQIGEYLVYRLRTKECDTIQYYKLDGSDKGILCEISPKEDRSDRLPAFRNAKITDSDTLLMDFFVSPTAEPRRYEFYSLNLETGEVKFQEAVSNKKGGSITRIGDKRFEITDRQISLIGLDGFETPLTQTAKVFCMDGGKIYYTRQDSNDLYCLDIQTNETDQFHIPITDNKIRIDEAIVIGVDGNRFLYGMWPNNLYVTNLESSEKSVYKPIQFILDGGGNDSYRRSLTVHPSGICVRQMGDFEGLTGFLPWEGFEMTELTTDSYRQYCIDDGWFYYVPFRLEWGAERFARIPLTGGEVEWLD